MIPSKFYVHYWNSVIISLNFVDFLLIVKAQFVNVYIYPRAITHALMLFQLNMMQTHFYSDTVELQ